MGRDDAEIATDVGDDRADRPAADHRVKPGGMLRRRSAPAWAEGQGEGRPPWWAWRPARHAVLVGPALGRAWLAQPAGAASATTLASSALASSRPRVMRARISPMSRVSKGNVTAARSLAARCCRVVARSLP